MNTKGLLFNTLVKSDCKQWCGLISRRTCPVKKKEYVTASYFRKAPDTERRENCRYAHDHGSASGFSLGGSIFQTSKSDKCEQIIENGNQGYNGGLPIIHHYGYVSDLPINHRFAMRKFHGVIRYLKQDNVISMKQVIQPELIDIETSTLAHTREYIESFFNGTTTKDEQRKTGFTWNEGLVRRCRLETGGTVLGAEIALQKGLACSTGGGTHHAYPSYGSGFCLINDLAIAAKYMLKQKLAERILIVDLDVHQGDGTAFTCKDDEHIFTFSMHCRSNFPLKKQQSDLDLELNDKMEDAEYMAELKTHLPTILNSFNPDLILYDAGVDPHVRDELGRLNLTDAGLFERDYYVLNEGVSRGIPCFTVIGGGYCRDLNELSVRHTIVHRAATKVWKEKNL